MIQTKVVQKIRTHILCSIIPPAPENRAGYKMWKNIYGQLDKPQMKT
jgi:hypothetical protein